MGTAFLHGNGGGGNERAVWIQAYPTEAALLADVPRSQTIGVVTGTAITRCCIQPTVPGSTEGWIWIKDNSSTWVSNHLQVINGTGNPPTYIPVFPSGCMQYINGAWKNKIAYFYKGGKWVQFSSDTYWIFNQGNTVDYTGGWGGSGNYTGNVLSVANGSDSGWINNRNIYSAKKIDMSSYSVLHFVVSSYEDPSSFGLSGNTDNGDYSTAKVSVTAVKEYTINTSALTGSYYVKLGSTGKQASGSSWTNIGYAVTKIWLE